MRNQYPKSHDIVGRPGVADTRCVNLVDVDGGVISKVTLIILLEEFLYLDIKEQRTGRPNGSIRPRSAPSPGRTRSPGRTCGPGRTW